LADNMRVRFHMSGVIMILMGAGGAILSLLWDVIYRGTAFKMSAVGPYKLLGLAAGLSLIVAGVIAGVILGRRAASRAGPGGISSPASTYKLIGLLLVFGGLGGTFLSLLWDVIRRGKPFSAEAIGPMKMMGIGAGILLLVIGIVMVMVLARRKPAVQPEKPAPAAPLAAEEPVQAPAASVQPAAMPQFQASETAAPSVYYAQYSETAPPTGYFAQTSESPPPSEYYAQASETDAATQSQAHVQEEIPFALPVEDEHPAQAIAVPLEAIPIEDGPIDKQHRRPW
jgi:hypothetical protein